MSTREQYINQVRYQNKVRTMFGTDGDNPIPTLNELLPVVVVENDRFESRFPGNEFSFVGGLSVAAGGAGNSSNVALLNPTGSGILATVEAISQLSASVIGAVAESVITASYTQTTTDLITRDFRGFGSACQIWSRNNAVPPTARGRLQAGGTHYVNFSIAPGQAIVLWGVTLNAVAEITYFWYERALDLSTK